MKKLLKFLGIGLLSIVAIIVLIALFFNVKGIPSYEVEPIVYEHTSSPEAIERGKKLTSMLCASCHLDHKTGALTGHLMMDAPKEFGEIYSQNITQDKEYGIGDWTDAEILYLLRTGIKRDGMYAPPYMAKLPNMADEDINAIIAFLRSDDPLVNPNATPDKPCEPSLLTKLLSHIAFKPFAFPTEKIAMPDTANKQELGKYLAVNLDCFSCHSADFKTVDYLSPENSPGYFGGGNLLLNMEGNEMVSANLTPDMETGIGNMSELEFIKAVKFGQKEGEPALQFPMLPYTQLTDYEAASIYAYLKTIDPISNKVERKIY